MITGDRRIPDLSIYHCGPGAKQQWCFKGEQPSTRARRARNVGKKIIASAFVKVVMDCTTVPLNDSKIVTSEWYVLFVHQMCAVRSEKRQISGLSGLQWHHDNAPAYSAAGR